MTAALVVYALAALTVFALLYGHALDGFEKQESFSLFMLTIVAVLWPLYFPALAFDWIAARRGGR